MAQMRITDGKGVHFTHDNGLTISIQIGGGNYSDNYNERVGAGRLEPGYVLPASKTAEIAVWTADGTWVEIEPGDVKGYVPIADVLRFIAFLSELPSGMSKAEADAAVSAFDWREQTAA